MTSYRQTTYNDFETPSGAVGEAPDGPGAFAHVMDQVDARIGIGGAEYAGGGVNAIPTSRRFVGKLAYWPAGDTLYRYVGAGNTALAANNPTATWQAWEKPATPFSPSWNAGITTGSATYVAFWGISAGVFWVDVSGTAGAGYSVSTSADTVLSAPSNFVAYGMGGGSGQYYKAGSSANNQQVDLAILGIGSSGGATAQIRVRAKWANAAPGPVTHNILGSVITSTTTDTFQIHFQAPSAIVA